MYKKGQTNPEKFIPISSMGPKHALKDTDLIFHLDLNYIMGSQWQWSVEFLELLSVVNMQLYACRKKLEVFRVRLDILYIKLVF